jgi:hypothetical protein
MTTVEPRAATGRLTVNPGDTIVSTWGNTTFDQTMEVFDTAAARDSQWATPHDGALAYTLDTQTAWLRRSGAWIALYPPAVSLRDTGHARVYRNAAFTATAGATFLFDTVDRDPLGLYSASTGKFTIPAGGGGWWLLQSHYEVAPTAANQWCQIIGQKNGANYGQGVQAFSNSTLAPWLNPHLSISIFCAVGDTVNVYKGASVATLTGTTGSFASWATFDYLGTG